MNGPKVNNQLPIMTGKQILMTSLTPEELVELFRPIIQEELCRLNDGKEEKLLSPAKTCEIFEPHISKTTLTSWTQQGFLKEHRIGGRVFYKLSEILEKSKTLSKYKRTS